MSKRQEALRILALGLSQREIFKAVKISSATITELRKFCNDRKMSFIDA